MKKLLAVLLALAMLAALASCGSKTGGDENSSTTSTEADTAEAVTDETEAVTQESETEKAEESTEAEESKTKEDKSEKETEKKEEEEETQAVKAPETKAEVLAAYNDAINGAYSAKAGFSKERYTDNAQYDMSIVLNTFKSLVEKFIGIGESNKYSETVTKGQWDSDAKHHYLRKSTLTEADISNATCKTEGNNYVFTIDIKGASSVGNKNSRQSSGPIDKCGICVGNEDKNYYDHKSGPVIYDAIGGTFENAEIKESYSNAKAVAKVDKETGKLVSLTVTFDIKVDISGVGGKGTATGTTHVAYKNFKY